MIDQERPPLPSYRLDAAGGSAFPNHGTSASHPTGPGMTLRDYFAAQALTGWLADAAMNRIMIEKTDDISKAMQMLAEGCYKVADAMLKERAK
jgi:hypothetical protein